VKTVDQHNKWDLFRAIGKACPRVEGIRKVETPIHDSIRELITWECKEHGVNIMNVLANPKGKCWALESEFLEA
jgi:hypothetical protein